MQGYSKNALARCEFVFHPYVCKCAKYFRVECQMQIYSRFLSLSIPQEYRQILILGCGFDSLALNIAMRGKCCATFEVDFQDVISRKVERIHSYLIPKCEELQKQIIGQPYQVDTGSGSSYHQIGPMRYFGRDISSREEVDKLLIDLVELGGFQRFAPTLIITECVLVYMKKEESTYLIDSLLSYLTSTKLEDNVSVAKDEILTAPQQVNPFVCWASYDMINPSDPFGETMLKNIRRRGLHIHGFLDYPSLQHQEERFLKWKDIFRARIASSSSNNCEQESKKRNKWRCRSRNMLQVYNHKDGIINELERKRIEGLEMLDEVEEWNLIMSHYCMTVCTISAEEGIDLEASELINHILPP